MERSSKSIIGALGSGALALILLYGSIQLPFGTLAAPGEGFMLIIVSIVTLAICIYGICKEFILPTGKTVIEADLLAEDEDKPIEKVNNKRPLKIIIAIIIYPILLVNLGFMLSTTALLFVTLRFMEYRGLWISLLIAIVTTFIMKFIFDDLFGVSLPAGLFS